MKYINLPKPHGFLIWRGKQKAIGLPTPTLSGQKVMIVSDGEPYGEAVFGEPVEMLLPEFTKFESEHSVRPEEIKMLWPNVTTFYTQWIKDFQPYEDFEQDGEKQKRICTRKSLLLTGDEAQLIDALEPTEAQKELLTRAERLPKTIVLLDDAVTLEDGKAIIAPGCEACQPVLDAVLNGAKALDTSLHAYQLTLTRVPRLALKKKELEAMEGEKCGPDLYVPYGVYTFADLMAAHEAQETAQEIAGLSQQFTGLVSNIMGSPDVADKPSALTSLTKELASLMKQEANGEMAKGYDAEILTGGTKTAEGPNVPYSGKFISTMNEGEKAGRKVKGSMMDKIKAAYETLKDFVSWAEPMEDDEDLTEKGIAIKQVNGKPWFIAYSTNAFEDRENEIFSTKALEKYVEEAELKSDRGYFNFWHIKTKANPALTDFAKKEWQGVEGRFLIEAGPFLDDEKGQAALKFFTEYPDGHPDIAPEGWGCSPEYRYLPEERKSGTYDNIWITRTSTLPRLAAANIWTKGTTMAISEQQKQAANTIFGEALATKIFKSAEDATKELEEAGIAHKSIEDAPVTEEPKPAGITLDDLQPFVEAMNLLATGQAELKDLIATQAGEIKQLKIAEAVKTQTQTPRAQLFTLQRATEAQKTIIQADDPLLPKAEPVKQDGSGAQHFFPQKG